tara:strand:- start:560 stop:1693 length:1134 start_codon:yes stop_codon:yes gene_type:complete
VGWSQHHPIGLIYEDVNQVYPGYTLVVTNSGLGAGADGNKYASLIDMSGQICHRWQCDEGISYGQILANGHLLMRTWAPQKGIDGEPMAGSSTAILELDWDSNIVWEYRNNALHHDFVRLASGNTLVLLWEKLTQEETNKITGGIFRDSDPDQMMADVIAEIGPQGQVIKKWYVKEFLDFEKDVICPLEGRHGWTHGNSLDVMPNGDILVSFRQINVIAIVDQSSGVAKWKWGPGDISHQHDATHVGNGNVMIFDNGSHRFGVSYSRVLEINPVSNTIVWEYRGSPPIAFYSFNLGSAQRLPNGNTLICEGAPGRLVEVTKMGEIVWEYISPFTVVSRTGTFTNAIFKAFRYAFDHAGFVGKNLDPVQYDGLNRMLN